MDTCETVLERRPIVASAAVLAIALGVYAAISVAISGGVDPLETGLFAAAFTVVYVAVAGPTDRLRARLG